MVDAKLHSSIRLSLVLVRSNTHIRFILTTPTLDNECVLSRMDGWGGRVRISELHKVKLGIYSSSGVIS